MEWILFDTDWAFYTDTDSFRAGWIPQEQVPERKPTIPSSSS